MSSRGLRGSRPAAGDFDGGIDRGLGSGLGVYQFAFKAASVSELEAKREELEGKGIKVRGVVDHGWCQSIYFYDPNFVQLEFCCLTADLTEAHVAGRHSAAWRRLARR